MRSVERRRGEAERAAVVGALVHGGLAARSRPRTRRRCRARRAGRCRSRAGAPRGSGSSRSAPSPSHRRRSSIRGEGQRGLRHPAARALAVARRRRDRLLHPDAQGGLVHRSRCPRPSASGPTSAGTPGGSRWRARARPRPGTACDQGPSRPFDGRRRPSSEPRGPPRSSRPPSRRSRRRGTRSRRSPRRPSPASSSRRGAGGGATRARRAPRSSIRSSQASRQPGPATSGSGAIALKDSMRAAHESISRASRRRRGSGRRRRSGRRWSRG